MIYTSLPKRKPKKPTAMQRQLAADWEALLKKHAAKNLKAQSNKLDYKLSDGPRGRSKHIESLNEWVTGPVSSKQTQQYTGTNMLGTSILHKSCIQPIFSKIEAESHAQMRR